MKSKVKSRFLIFMLYLILSGMAMLGCSNGSGEGDVPELAGVSFGFMEGSEKVISISREALRYDSFYWNYTAAWKGDAGVAPEGVQSEMKAVKDGAGFDAELVGFTPGSWEFELFGYSDPGRTKLVFSGTSGTVVLSAGSKTTVTVDVDYSTTGTGTIKLGRITFKEGTGYALESITVDGEAKALDADDQLTNIAAGNHTVYLKYSGTGGYYEAKVLVTVSAGVTTDIEGQLDLLVAAAPTGLAGEKPSYYGQADGKITGLDTSKTYQYSADGGSTWTDVTGNSEVTGLAAGDYKVRVSGVRPGTAVDVTVPAGDFRVTLCAGKGSGTDTYDYVEAGTSYTIPASAFTAKIPAGVVNEGADIPFKCWNDGSADKNVGESIEVNDNITLTAQWTKPVFSVSATKKVCFAKGNLQATYNGSSYTWGFAANQNEYVGVAAGNTTIGSQASGAKVDLFGWSTSATDYGISSATGSSKYYGNFKDWGGIESLPGNNSTTKVWRTLTKDEWAYLFNTRTINGGKGEGKSYSFGITYGGKVGTVLYPDNYTGSVLSGTLDALPEGVVFLPAAGSRYGSEVFSVGSYGYCWTSTVYSDYSAYFLYLGGNVIDPEDDGQRCFGFSVRLVCGE